MVKLFRAIGVFVLVALPVHLLYIGLIRPMAEQDIEAARGLGKSAPRTLWVILKDWEQEICIVLMFCCAWFILVRIFSILSNQYLFEVDLLKDANSDKDNLLNSLTDLEKLPGKIGDSPLVSTLKASIRRYSITDNVQNASDAINTSVQTLSISMEADSAMIRYMIWAIPSIGFIGTVRGIGEALARAEEALAGDIASMTASLGIAFNSTFVALIASIFLMLLLHAMQRLQDKVLVDTQAYCEEFLLKRISR